MGVWKTMGWDGPRAEQAALLRVLFFTVPER